jgi:hypothetical protein
LWYLNWIARDLLSFDEFGGGGGENFSSKTKEVADEYLLFQKHTNFLVKLQYLVLQLLFISQLNFSFQKKNRQMKACQLTNNPVKILQFPDLGSDF